MKRLRNVLSVASSSSKGMGWSEFPGVFPVAVCPCSMVYLLVYHQYNIHCRPEEVEVEVEVVVYRASIYLYIYIYVY
jgi:hypothetical protein